MVGQAGFFRHEGRKQYHKGSIWGVYVTAAARGRKAAQAMMLCILDRVRGYPGLEQVTLSVSVSQEAARRLYDALGFEVYGYEQRALKVEDTYVDEEHRVLWLHNPPAGSRLT
jgi:ribosomal protein S18 acetylase RimI-like enzyme